MKIESGTGNGKWARVDNKNRLLVNSKSNFAQHTIASEDNSTFQIWGTANLANGTVTPLTLKNTAINKQAVLTYIRLQVVDPAGGTAVPNASNYFQLGYDAEFSSGGTQITPTNMTAGASVQSGTACYHENPTMSGTLSVFDRHYPQSEGGMYSFSKNGAAIILPGQSLTVQFVGDNTSGIAYSRVSFYTEDIG